MCKRCKIEDVKVGDVMWRATIWEDFGDKYRVDVSCAVITKTPNKARRVKIRESPANKKSSWAFFGLGTMVPLDMLRHSKLAALHALFAIEDAAYNVALRRVRLADQACKKVGGRA